VKHKGGLAGHALARRTVKRTTIDRSLHALRISGELVPFRTGRAEGAGAIAAVGLAAFREDYGQQQ